MGTSDTIHTTLRRLRGVLFKSKVTDLHPREDYAEFSDAVEERWVEFEDSNGFLIRSKNWFFV